MSTVSNDYVANLIFYDLAKKPCHDLSVMMKSICAAGETAVTIRLSPEKTR